MRSHLLNNPGFLGDFEKLAGVSLNPERHTSPNAWAHSLAVARRAWLLAVANGLDEAAATELHDLGLVHDIGKIGGTTAASKSVELLPKYGLVEPSFVELVHYHDVNLPWFMSTSRGEPPSDKAWRKMASKVDMLRLALFMVADRVDCPGGRLANPALVWFLAETERRGLVGVSGLVLDVDDTDPPELSAGVVVVRERGGASGKEALALDLGRGGLELPKGHVEPGETPSQAARRELEEGAGVVLEADAALEPIATLAYEIAGGKSRGRFKYVHYARTSAPAVEGPLPPECRERVWLDAAAAAKAPLLAEALRALLLAALA